MYVIIKENETETSIYSEIVYHAECGFHAGFVPSYLHTSKKWEDRNDVKIYSKKFDAETDKRMLMEVYNEKNLKVTPVCIRIL